MARPLIPLLLLAVVAGCHAPPAGSRDAAPHPLDGEAGDGGTRANLIFDRSFGAEGEQPQALLLAPQGEILAISDRAIYRLAGDGRVLDRISIGALYTPPPKLISAAQGDGGLGLTLRLLEGGALLAGIALSLHDGGGALEKGPLPIAGPEAEARGAFDGQAHRIAWTRPVAGSASLELRLHSITRSGTMTTHGLATGLPSESSLADWLAAPGLGAACTLEPGGQALLRRFALESSGPAAEAPVAVGEPGRTAVGSCRLAWSGRALLAATRTRALSPAQVDLGVRTVDLALGAVAFDVPVARALRSGGQPGEAVRLSLIPGTVRVESLIWDGVRFLALTLAAGLAGGRLQLALLDEDGRVLARDLPLPLEYEPGSLSTACLAASATAGEYLAIYGSRRPWDEGVLHLVRFRLEGQPRRPDAVSGAW